MTSQIDQPAEPISFPLQEATSQPVPASNKHLPVASRLHLAIFLAVQVVVVVRSGSMLPRLIAIKEQPTFHFWLTCCYLFILAFEFAQLLFVWYGIRKTNTTISDLV